MASPMFCQRQILYYTCTKVPANGVRLDALMFVADDDALLDDID